MTPDPEPSTFSRRRFLKSVGGSIALLGFPTVIPSSALGKNGKPPPSERIAVGVLGCGIQSRVAYRYERQGGQIAALADPLGRRLQKWKSGGPFAERTLPEYADFRELLARDDIDAVHIAAGDYWHVPMALLAARAGKHIYVEKPLALSIEQALACREIIDRHPDLVVQYGTQNRSKIHVRGGVELLLNGHIGEVREIYVWAYPGVSGRECVPSEPPPDLDYDLWLGPAPEAPYCDRRCLKQGIDNAIFHKYDYAVGFIAGWGAHPYDQLQWWLDETGVGAPTRVEATGSIPTAGFLDTVTHWDVLVRYPNLPPVRFCDAETIENYLPPLEGMDKKQHGTLFVGDEGWLYFERHGWSASSRAILAQHKNPGPRRVIHSTSQTGNFLEAIRGETRPVSPLPSAIQSDLVCHLGDLAIRHGSPLDWDADQNTITNNEAARRAMHRPMREPWNVLDPRYTT